MTTATGTDQSPSVDAVLSVLADDLRRAVLRSLDHAASEEIPLGTLADRVAKRVRSEALSDDEQRQRLLITLHHSSLPQLAEAGLVVHDTEHDRIRGTAGPLGKELLSAVTRYDDQ